MTDPNATIFGEKAPLPEIGFYYPGWIWKSDQFIKNAILYFDGVALLVPEYMKNRPEDVDPALVVPLQENGLLHLLEPEKLVDAEVTEKLVDAFVELISSGALDNLPRGTRFSELSMSRMGSYGNSELYQLILDELLKRDLAQPTTDGRSIPLHPLVRSLYLTLLAQILRGPGRTLGLDLSPLTDQARIVEALKELIGLARIPSGGHVVTFDFATLGVDVTTVPLDDLLKFRADNSGDLKKYSRSIKSFVYELSIMKEEDRFDAFEQRREEIKHIAKQINRSSRSIWRQTSYFALSIAGAAWSAATGDLGIPLALGLGGSLIGSPDLKNVDTGVYSFLFKLDRHIF